MRCRDLANLGSPKVLLVLALYHLRLLVAIQSGSIAHLLWSAASGQRPEQRPNASISRSTMLCVETNSGTSVLPRWELRSMGLAGSSTYSSSCSSDSAYSISNIPKGSLVLGEAGEPGRNGANNGDVPHRRYSAVFFAGIGGRCARGSPCADQIVPDHFGSFLCPGPYRRPADGPLGPHLPSRNAPRPGTGSPGGRADRPLLCAAAERRRMQQQCFAPVSYSERGRDSSQGRRQDHRLDARGMGKPALCADPRGHGRAFPAIACRGFFRWLPRSSRIPATW